MGLAIFLFKLILCLFIAAPAIAGSPIGSDKLNEIEWAHSWEQAVDKDKAVDLLMTHIAQHPEDLDARYYIALAFLQNREYENVISNLLKLLQEKPSHSNGARLLSYVYNEQGLAFLRTAQFNKAIDSFSSGIVSTFSNKKELFVFYFNRALAKFESNDKNYIEDQQAAVRINRSMARKLGKYLSPVLLEFEFSQTSEELIDKFNKIWSEKCLHNNWLVLEQKGLPYTAQWILGPTAHFPTETIKKSWKQCSCWHITEVGYGKGGWVVVMSVGTDYEAQSYFGPVDDFPRE
jgi:tetratricopeptide (TPR) repeat protein